MDAKQIAIAVVAMVFGCVLPIAILMIGCMPQLNACSVAGAAVLVAAVLGSVGRALCESDEDEFPFVEQ